MASSSARRHRLAEDAVVGQFVIGGEIGKGSFAQVFIGKHKASTASEPPLHAAYMPISLPLSIIC